MSTLYMCVSLLVIFNPPFPVLKAGHSVFYSYICDVCMKWVNGWVSFYILSKIPVWLVCYARGFSCTCMCTNPQKSIHQ